VWRGPGRPTTAGNRWARKSIRKRAFVQISWPSDLRSRRAQASPLLFCIQELDSACSQSKRRKERQNLRAFGTSAGEKRGGDERLHSELASFSPATGDFRSPVVLPERCGGTFQAQHHSLCASAFFLWAGGSVPSVSLWFCWRWRQKSIHLEVLVVETENPAPARKREHCASFIVESRP